MERDVSNTLETMNRQFKELASLYHEEAGQYNITSNEFWVWYSLMTQEGEQSQQSICENWSLSKQTINSVVKSMMRRGFVYLESIPGTRNKKSINLTEKGREFGEQVILRVYQAEQRAVARLTADERRFCIDVLEKYLGFLREEL